MIQRNLWSHIWVRGLVTFFFYRGRITVWTHQCSCYYIFIDICQVTQLYTVSLVYRRLYKSFSQFFFALVIPMNSFRLYSLSIQLFYYWPFILSHQSLLAFTIIMYGVYTSDYIYLDSHTLQFALKWTLTQAYNVRRKYVWVLQYELMANTTHNTHHLYC